MIAEGFKTMFLKDPNSKEFGKDHSQGGMKKNSKDKFSSKDDTNQNTCCGLWTSRPHDQGLLECQKVK